MTSLWICHGFIVSWVYPFWISNTIELIPLILITSIENSSMKLWIEFQWIRFYKIKIQSYSIHFRELSYFWYMLFLILKTNLFLVCFFKIKKIMFKNYPLKKYDFLISCDIYMFLYRIHIWAFDVSNCCRDPATCQLQLNIRPSSARSRRPNSSRSYIFWNDFKQSWDKPVEFWGIWVR